MKVLLHKDKLDRAGSICQFDFADKRALSEALLMAGAFAGLPEGNKRIALIGDHVLALVVRLQSYARGHMIGDYMYVLVADRHG